MRNAIYALYDEQSELLNTFRNRKVAIDAQIESGLVSELRTYRFLTEKQIQLLPYATAVSIELTAIQNQIKVEKENENV